MAFPSIEGLDTQKGLARAAGSVKLYHKLLADYAKTQRSTGEAIRGHLAAGTLKEAERLAHSTKGASATTGAEPLAELAFGLVKSLREQNEAAAVAALPAFEEHVGALCEPILAHYAQTQAHDQASADVAGADPETVIRNLEQLTSLLETGSAKAETALDELRVMAAGLGWDAELDDLETAVEDVEFEQALDLVASDITGNCTVIVVKIPGIQSGTMLLESLHVIECVVPAEIGASRYLPPDVVRSMMTSHGVDVADKVPYSPWEKVIEIDRESIAKIIARQESGIRELIQHAEKSARQKFEPIQASALANMTTDMTREIKRLEALAEVNPNIRPDEIEYLKSAMKILSDAIERSQVRLDAVRLLICA